MRSIEGHEESLMQLLLAVCFCCMVETCRTIGDGSSSNAERDPADKPTWSLFASEREGDDDDDGGVWGDTVRTSFSSLSSEKVRNDTVIRGASDRRPDGCELPVHRMSPAVSQSSVHKQTPSTRNDKRTPIPLRIGATRVEERIRSLLWSFGVVAFLFPPPHLCKRKRGREGAPSVNDERRAQQRSDRQLLSKTTTTRERTWGFVTSHYHHHCCTAYYYAPSSSSLSLAFSHPILLVLDRLFHS